MKIKNINKKLLAGILGAVMLTTPIGLTACGTVIRDNGTSATQDQVSKGEYRYSFDKVKELKIITVESVGQEKKMLVSKLDGYRSQFLSPSEHFYFYSDFFSGVEFKENEVKILKEESLEEYLFAYDYLQKSYSKKELKDFFEKIKSEIYINEKGNVKVKK